MELHSFWCCSPAQSSSSFEAMQMIGASFAQFSEIRNCQFQNCKLKMRIRIKILLFPTFAHFRKNLIFYSSPWLIMSQNILKLKRTQNMMLLDKSCLQETLGWKVQRRRSLMIVPRSGSEGQMCSLCRRDTFLSELASVQIFYWLSVCYLLSLSSLPARGLGPGPGAGPGPADTVEGTLTWSHSSQHNIIQPTTLLCITKYETERGRKFTVT